MTTDPRNKKVDSSEYCKTLQANEQKQTTQICEMKINPKVTPQAPSDGNETPQLSYAQMITEAIMQAENRILTLKDICAHIHQNYPQFCKDDKMWQAAVSRNLSKNNKFQ